VVSAPRTAARATAGAPTASQTPFLALFAAVRSGSEWPLSAPPPRDCGVCLGPPPGRAAAGGRRYRPLELQASSACAGAAASHWLRTSPKLAWWAPLLSSLPLPPRRPQQKHAPGTWFASAGNQGGQALFGLLPASGEAQRPGRSWPRSEGPPSELPFPARASLGRGPRGSPATRARALPHSLTLTHTSLELGCGEGAPARSEDQAAAVRSGAGSGARALGGRL
jgi:hypothetical protein